MCHVRASKTMSLSEFLKAVCCFVVLTVSAVFLHCLHCGALSLTCACCAMLFYAK